MYELRGILRADRLALISDQPDAMRCEYLRGLFRHGRFSGNQNALLRSVFPRFVQDRRRILSAHGALVPGNPARPDKTIQRDPVNRFSILNKVVGRVNMGPVVGAHGEGRQIANRPVLDG